jgi:hypothetical protein
LKIGSPTSVFKITKIQMSMPFLEQLDITMKTWSPEFTETSTTPTPIAPGAPNKNTVPAQRALLQEPDFPIDGESSWVEDPEIPKPNADALTPTARKRMLDRRLYIQQPPLAPVPNKKRHRKFVAYHHAPPEITL